MRNSLFSAAALCLALAAGACNSDGSGSADSNDSLLSTDLVYNPASSSTPDNAKASAKLEIANPTHDFGTVREGEVVEHSFSFRNTGSGPLLISAAEASCGCTVPDYPREPVAPGKTGVIKVKFNSAGKPGEQQKIVTVNSNSSTGQERITITAEVTPKG